MVTSNTPAATTCLAVNHVKNYMTQVQIVAHADCDFPMSKRGITHSMRAHGMQASTTSDAKVTKPQTRITLIAD
jgi:hypothetical protein